MNPEARRNQMLRKAFSDICRGFSCVVVNGEKVYIKHFSHHDHIDLEITQNSFYDTAVSRGLPTEKEVLGNLMKEGIWTDKDEAELNSLESRIKKLISQKKNIILPSRLEEHNKLIKKQENLYMMKRSERENHMTITAESYSEKKLNQFYIIESFYEDPNFEKKYLPPEKFDELEDIEIRGFIALYNSEMSTMSDESIKKIAIEDFFQVYWGLSSDNAGEFFGKTVCDLSYFQIKLASYGKMFRDILSKAENIPENIKKDPDKLMDYVRAGEKAKEQMERTSGDKDNSATTFFGATKEDLKTMGADDTNTIKLSKILEENKKKGKKEVGMHEIMKFMGK